MDIMNNIGRFYGMHLFGEFYGVDQKLLDDECYLITALSKSVVKSGASILGRQSHKFKPSGVTILLLLAESHASIHTYPESQSIFIDIFTCGDCNPETSIIEFEKYLCPTNKNVNIYIRGEG